MFDFKALTVVACVAGLLSGCFDGSSSSNSGNGTDVDTPVGGTFTSFVADLFADTSDTAEPVAVNDRDFTFSEDEGAFDNLIQQQ